MISGETLTVSLEEAIENHLLRSGNPAANSGGEDYWATVENHVAAEDYTPLLGLVAELRDKIIGLTPRRRDLAAETSEAMDVELLEQMMDYGAFDVVRARFLGSFFRLVCLSLCLCLSVTLSLLSLGVCVFVLFGHVFDCALASYGRHSRNLYPRTCFYRTWTL